MEFATYQEAHDYCRANGIHPYRIVWETVSDYRIVWSLYLEGN